MWTNIDVTRRHHSPFVVRGPKLPPQPTSVAGSPSAPAPKNMKHKDRHVQGDQGRRDERPSSTDAKRGPEPLAIRAAMGHPMIRSLNDGDRGSTESRPLFGDHTSERHAGNDQKREDYEHIRYSSRAMPDGRPNQARIQVVAAAADADDVKTRVRATRFVTRARAA